IEWYYGQNGNSPAYDYFLKISQEQKRKFLVLVKRMGDFGKIYDKTKFTYEGDKIYAFKPQPDRYLSFFTKDKKIIVTNGFWKKTQKNKLPVFYSPLPSLGSLYHIIKFVLRGSG
ncbi:MAG: type II toxin-antitoxin system RelE/ParE family toxin, partial [Treponema sp.]|nr:type II toxin-antitoxin system RelE/ParE family toxin [Treponema sp.]